MEFRPQQITDCYVIAPEPVADDRGSFARVFSADEFGDRGLETNIWQINLSRCHTIGTIRGIHWQADPYSEAKLARCVRGRVFDVCVDVRSGSDSLGSWVGAELTPENQLAMYVSQVADMVTRRWNRVQSCCTRHRAHMCPRRREGSGGMIRCSGSSGLLRKGPFSRTRTATGRTFRQL